MRLLLFALFSLSLCARGETLRILSYRQLAAMPPSKRIQYIKDLRQMLVEMQHLGTKHASSASPSLSESVARVLKQLEAIPEAAAADATCPGGMKAFPGNPSLSGCMVKSESECQGRGFSSRRAAKGLWCVRQLVPQAVTPTPPAAAAKPAPGNRARAADAVLAPGKDGQTPDGQATKEPTAATGLNGSPPGVCASRDDQRQALEGFLQEKGSLSCVMGGTFSSYRGKKPTKGQCKALDRYPFQSQEGGSKKTEAGALNLNCPAHQSMCNPLLYCTEPDPQSQGKYKALCADVSQDLTDACEKVTVEKKLPDCDPFTDPGLKDVPGLQNEWNDFKKNFKELCEPEGGFSKFFCVECGFMKKRLDAINAKHPDGGVEGSVAPQAQGAEPSPGAADAAQRENKSDNPKTQGP